MTRQAFLVAERAGRLHQLQYDHRGITGGLCWQRRSSRSQNGGGGPAKHRAESGKPRLLVHSRLDKLKRRGALLRVTSQQREKSLDERIGIDPLSPPPQFLQVALKEGNIVLHQCIGQNVFGWKELIERTNRCARSGGDLRHGRRLITLLAKDRRGSIQQLRDPLLAALALWKSGATDFNCA